MHQIFCIELHWFIFAAIILLFVWVGMVRFIFRLDRPTNHKWNIFWLMALAAFIATWITLFCQ
ncbi:hypothetical protein [Fibrella forsythiae]|uniref:Cardiolipin synthase N-terminal domain-containing protein n=1 Tax=Fibrella forsythiae TaxID=2817061 RepID=A0ABS3JEK3_9BACT|nr:hypothetical protein [Fibrella forsythiae]MBO0947297.1 hypothetical protein [Fibrella forsythiae]